MYHIPSLYKQKRSNNLFKTITPQGSIIYIQL